MYHYGIAHRRRSWSCPGAKEGIGDASAQRLAYTNSCRRAEWGVRSSDDNQVLHVDAVVV
jgi:hypothetical protein